LKTDRGDGRREIKKRIAADGPHKQGGFTMGLTNTIKGKKPTAEQLADRVKEARSAVAKTQSELDQAEASAVAAVADNDAYANARGEVAAIRARLTEQSELLERLRSAHKNQFDAEQADYAARLEKRISALLERHTSSNHECAQGLAEAKRVYEETCKKLEADRDAVLISMRTLESELQRARAGIPESAHAAREKLREENRELRLSIAQDEQTLQALEIEWRNAHGRVAIAGSGLGEARAANRDVHDASEKIASMKKRLAPTHEQIKRNSEAMAALEVPPRPL
jgi:chromosome segregation ATPase